MKIAPYHALALLLAGVPLACAQDGATRTIALTGTSALSLGGNFMSFSEPVLNGSGVVAFVGHTLAEEGIYETSGANLLSIATSLQIAPVILGTFKNFTAPVINESGLVAFSAHNGTGTPVAIYTSSGTIPITAYGLPAPGLGANISDLNANIALSDTGTVAFLANTPAASGEYFGTGGTPTTLATSVQTAPGTGTLYGTFYAPVQNNTGTTAFVSQNGSVQGLYTTFGTTLSTVATTGQAAPGIGGTFTLLSTKPAINDSGSVAFFGIAGTAKGVFARVDGVLSAVASTARQAPGFSANFSNFSDPAISNSGSVAFRGLVSGGGAGIYTGTGGPTLQTIAITGQSAPGAGGVFSSFGKPAINDLGTVAFYGSSGGGSGLYLGDGQQLVTVATTGQSLSGSTISGLSTFSGGTDRGGSSQLNNNGQFAYMAALANGTAWSIQLFTPTLHIRSSVSGAWATRAGWTLGILPAAVHDVVIDPAAALTITGPMLPTTVRSLAINGSGANVSELTLQSTGTLTAPSGASIGVSGRLGGSGRLTANLTNSGAIAPGAGSTTGSITVTGNVTLQSTAHLAFDLGGLTRKTGYDFLGITGQLTLGGSLDVSLLGGFTPLAGNSFDLFDATSITGAFAPGSVHLPTLAGGLTWNTALLPTTGVISVAGFSTTPTTYTLAASASAGLIHAGGSSTITATVTNTGAAGADTLNFSGLNVAVSPAGGNVTALALANAALASGNTAQSGTATFSSTIGGTYTLTPVVAAAANGTLGGAATNGGVTAATVTVFSGAAKWVASGTAAWGSGANANWTDTAAASVHAAPGTFANFATNDTAVFDGTTAGSTVQLNGAAPSLAAISFTGGSHTLAQGTGGTLTLNGGAGPATVSDSSGSATISAPVQLDSNAAAAVTNAADTLTLSGTLTGAGKSLTKTGAGSLLLSGAQNYAVLNASGGLTRLGGSFTGGTAIVHANAPVKFEASQTLAALTIADGVEVTFGNGTAPSFDGTPEKIDGLAVVPEPGTGGLLLVGSLGFLARRRPSAAR